jgi:hypothetical protein
MPLRFQPGTPRDEIDFLRDFVNGDWRPLQSIPLFEALLTQPIFGQRATPKSIERLRDQARRHLRTISQRRVPSITITVQETIGRRRRRRRSPNLRATDFGARVQLAVRHLIEARGKVRACPRCDDFFYPKGPEVYCRRCRGGHVAQAIRLEQAQERTRRYRLRQARDGSERARLEAQRDVFLQRAREHTLSADCRRRLARIDDRLMVLERAANAKPPDPPVKRWETIVQIGGWLSDVAIPVCGGRPAEPTTDVNVPAETRSLTQVFGGTYADALKEYREERRKAKGSST